MNKEEDIITIEDTRERMTREQAFMKYEACDDCGTWFDEKHRCSATHKIVQAKYKIEED